MTLLRVLRLHGAEDLELPRYETAGASGLDLRAARDAELAPGETAVIPTGIAVELPEGHEGQVRPRSGLSRRGVVTVLGTIDRDYTGEVGVILQNHTREPVRVERGARIAQLVVAPVARCGVIEVAEIRATARGAGGFGSTGER